jgi:hypothetical protein
MPVSNRSSAPANARMKLSLAAYSFRDARLKIRRTTVPQYLQQLRKLLG